MPESLSRKLTADEFIERFREQETRECQSAADTLYHHALADQPDMIRAALRGDLRPVVIYGGWRHGRWPSDETIEAMAVMPSGAVAALVTDNKASAQADADRIAAALAPKLADIVSGGSVAALVANALPVGRLGNAPEAAHILGITEQALRGRERRGDLPPGSVVRTGRTGRRLQFRLDKLLADPVKRRKRAR